MSSLGAQCLGGGGAMGCIKPSRPRRALTSRTNLSLSPLSRTRQVPHIKEEGFLNPHCTLQCSSFVAVFKDRGSLHLHSTALYRLQNPLFALKKPGGVSDTTSATVQIHNAASTTLIRVVIGAITMVYFFFYGTENGL